MGGDKKTFTRFTCRRCGENVEVTGGILARAPSSWSKINGALLCPSCVREYQAMFRTFMSEGRKK